MKNDITKNKVKEWLKSEHIDEVDVDNAIEVLYCLASGQYTIGKLREDVRNHYNNNWEYMEDK
jgi:hypothetical protein|tara:strand:+ start:406 stop:594 length:189 start_codon:yes stop_codon:yes gene_type:complete